MMQQLLIIPGEASLGAHVWEAIGKEEGGERGERERGEGRRGEGRHEGGGGGGGREAGALSCKRGLNRNESYCVCVLCIMYT
jgi:hypothetical protein